MDDLDQLDDLALDLLPFGVIGVGHDGTVRRYNRALAERAGMSRWRVIGRRIDEIAGAMGATEIASRVAAFADARGDATVGGVPFHCRLARRGVADHATVELRAGGTRAQVYVCIAA